MIDSFSSTLEALWCAHSIQEMSDPRDMGSTLQAQLDSLEDSVNKLLTLSEVMSKLQKGLGRHLLFWIPCSKPSLKGFSSPGAVFVSLCHPVPQVCAFSLTMGHFLHSQLPLLHCREGQQAPCLMVTPWAELSLVWLVHPPFLCPKMNVQE